MCLAVTCAPLQPLGSWMSLAEYAQLHAVSLFSVFVRQRNLCAQIPTNFCVISSAFSVLDNALRDMAFLGF